jgi:hypothetical protein
MQCLAPHLETSLRSVADLSPRKGGERLKKSGASGGISMQKYHNQPYSELHRSDFNKEVACLQYKLLA